MAERQPGGMEEDRLTDDLRLITGNPKAQLNNSQKELLKLIGEILTEPGRPCFECLNSSWEQSKDLSVCVRECGDWEDSDPDGGSQDKTKPDIERGQESQDTGNYFSSSFDHWTSEQFSNQISCEYEQDWSDGFRNINMPRTQY